MSEGQQATSTESRGRRKMRQGRVVSDKMDKTVVVAVESRVRHPLTRPAVELCHVSNMDIRESAEIEFLLLMSS